LFEVGDAGAQPRLIAHAAPTVAAGSIVWSDDKILAVDESKGSMDGRVGGRLLTFNVSSLLAGSDAPIGDISTAGSFPCSVSLDPLGDFVAVANYGSEDFVVRLASGPGGDPAVYRERDHGSVALFPLSAGIPTAITSLIPHRSAAGHDRTWQLSGHPHAVTWSPDGRHVAVADRGADTVTLYAIDREASQLSPVCAVGANPGEGPRSAVFSPHETVLVVANELRATVATYRYGAAEGVLIPEALVPTDPPGYVPENPDDFFSLTHPSAMAISRDGESLFVLNRGPNTVAWFDVKGPQLHLRSVTASGGEGPWGLALAPDGDRLWVAHRISGDVVEFMKSGEELVPTGRRASVPGAVSIAFGYC